MVEDFDQKRASPVVEKILTGTLFKYIIDTVKEQMIMKKDNQKIKSDDIRETVRKGKKQKNINKKILIKKLVIFIIILCIASGIYIIIKNRKVNVKSEEIFEYDYFLLSENGKSGIIDKSGNVIIQPEYDYIQIPNPGKAIFICLYDYNSLTQEYSSKVLNEKGEEIYKQYSNITAITSNNTSSKNEYQTGILKYKENGKYGIITIYGKKVTSPIYDSVDTLDYKDDVLKISENSKYGLIKINSDTIIKPEYDSISADGYYDEDTKYEKAGYIVCTKTDDGYRYGYISNSSKKVLDCKYNNIKRITEIKNDSSAYLITYENGLAGLYKNAQNVIKNEYESIDFDDVNSILSLAKNGKYGVYDLYGNMILPIQYDDITFAGKLITAHKDGEQLIFDVNGNIQKNALYTSVSATSSNQYYITIDLNGNYGVMNSDKVPLVKNEYENITYAFDKYFIVTKDEKVGLVDDSGKVILDIKYNMIQNINGTKILETITSDSTQLYNKDLSKILEVSKPRILIKDNYIEVVSDDDINYLDFDGNKVEAISVLKDNKIFAKKQNGKWGYVDYNGNVVVDYKYDFAIDINEYGFGAIKENGKWGVVDSNGKIVKEPTYTLNNTLPSFIGEFYKQNTEYDTNSYSNDVL